MRMIYFRGYYYTNLPKRLFCQPWQEKKEEKKIRKEGKVDFLQKIAIISSTQGAKVI